MSCSEGRRGGRARQKWAALCVRSGSPLLAFAGVWWAGGFRSERKRRASEWEGGEGPKAPYPRQGTQALIKIFFVLFVLPSFSFSLPPLVLLPLTPPSLILIHLFLPPFRPPPSFPASTRSLSSSRTDPNDSHLSLIQPLYDGLIQLHR